MRATPSLRCLASTMTRPASSWVICEVSSRAPSAMPTRSAPSSRALALIACAVSGFRNISMQLTLAAFELLQLLRHDALVSVRPDPAPVPFRESRDRRAGFAVLLVLLLQRVLLRRALGNVLVYIGEMRVVVVADRANGEAART